MYLSLHSSKCLFNSYSLQSAFSIRLGRFGVNHYTMYGPDELHEFDIGAWKAVFLHLLRLLVALGNNSVQNFDERHANLSGLIYYTDIFAFRFREVPTFAGDVIRRFCVNVSSQTRITARDYEDLLQVCLFSFNSILLYPDVNISVYYTRHRGIFPQER